MMWITSETVYAVLFVVASLLAAAALAIQQAFVMDRRERFIVEFGRVAAVLFLVLGWILFVAWWVTCLHRIVEALAR